MNRRTSTNVKLSQIIHSNADEKETREIIENREKLAKLRLQRACLYGGGARTLLPKVRKVKKSLVSPFQIEGGEKELPPPQPLFTSAPPVAHDEQFRLVRNPTRLALNDPDRYCINTSRMIEGYRHVPEPPWYVGYQNTTVPPDSNPMLSASRYGFRGSKKILQYNTKPYELPSKTRNEYTPKFLNVDKDYVDEYVPPIVAATAQTVNCIETPKLWPENTEFVYGYKNKKNPTSSIYKRETTIGLNQRPTSPESLNDVYNKIDEERRQLIDYSRMESDKTFQSLPIQSQEKWDAKWKEYVIKDSNKSLKSTLKLSGTKPPYEAHTLLDPSDTMHYSGSTAMIIHSQTTEELKFRLRMERTKNRVNQPFTIKWQHIVGHFDNISVKLKKNQSMSEAIIKIAELFQQAAIRYGSETSLRRVEFVKTCQLIPYFSDVSSKQLSHIFSLFDPMEKDVMRYVEFILCLSIFDHPEALPLEKLRTLWKLIYTYGLDRSLFDIVHEVLTSCSSSISDVAEIEKLIIDEFRPNCYTMAIQYQSTLSSISQEKQNYLDSTNSLNSTFGNTIENDSRPTSGPLIPFSDPETKVSETFDGNKFNTFSHTGTSQSKKSSFVQHQYNICENYLNEDSFIEVMKKCSNLLLTFDKQLSTRLTACYGKDERYVDKSKDQINTEELDFSWIMKRSPPKKKPVISLYDEEPH